VEKIEFQGYPLPLFPRKALTGAESAKMACKILRALELEVKILTTNDLVRLSREEATPPPP
jgi:hypothetical protein